MLLQGQALRAARGNRTVKEIVSGIIDSKTGKQLTGGRYQHWERGLNAPRRHLWAQLSKRLGINLADLYGEDTQQSKAIEVAAVLRVVHELRKNLDLLETLITPAVDDKRVLKRKPPKKRGKASA